MFYLTMHSTHFNCGYAASDIWLRTTQMVKTGSLQPSRNGPLFLISSKGSFICTIP